MEWLVATAHRRAVYQQAGEDWREIGGYNINLCSPRGHDARELLRQGPTLSPSLMPDLTIGETRVPLTLNTDCPA